MWFTRRDWLASLVVIGMAGPSAAVAGTTPLAGTPGYAPEALTLGRDLDGDADPDEVSIRLEVIEIQEEVWPGQFVTFWVFAPEGRGMTPVARAPSPTIRVEEGDRVRITLLNPHYFPHTIHPHGTIHPNAMDGVPDFTQAATRPGEAFTYAFVAKNPGTHWYHCHVQPDVHVLMGLAGMLIIEPNRPDNDFTRLVVGAGEMPDLARATREAGYDREYSLVYMDMDDRLSRIPAAVKDPREIEMRMHRDYDSTRRAPNVFLLNGRSFPFTLRDTPIEVREGERTKLRILNAGARTISLHTHGHHPILTHVDGYALAEGARQVRDTFTIGPAQRIDLDLRTGSDGYYASGPGVWIMHDHTEPAVTNKGINPGGDITAIVYEGYMDENGLPKVATSLERFFDPAFYRGEVPVFDPAIFHTTAERYAYGWAEETLAELPDYPVQERATGPPPEDVLETHRIVARSCEKPRGFRRIEVKGGARFAREGEVYAFEPRVIRVGRCEEVEVALELTDQVRHAFMIPGLNPMFMHEFTGPGTRVARFVTPDADVTLEFHCHVQTHQKLGMEGIIVVGEGSPGTAARAEPGRHALAGEEPSPGPEAAAAAARGGELREGVGVLLSVDERRGRVVVDHEEIPGFMSAMTMSYAVDPPGLVRGLPAGARVRFVIDAEKRMIVEIAPASD